MAIEEFPFHITEKIKNTWETWNSPPRLSSDSLHLDEIEEMNLNNMDDARWKKPLMLIKHPHEDKQVLQHGRCHQTKDDVSNDGSYHDTSK
ncbi:hypothetical protein Gotur_027402 [Gossypium turneri]